MIWVEQHPWLVPTAIVGIIVLLYLRYNKYSRAYRAENRWIKQNKEDK